MRIDLKQELKMFFPVSDGIDVIDVKNGGYTSTIYPLADDLMVIFPPIGTVGLSMIEPKITNNLTGLSTRHIATIVLTQSDEYVITKCGRFVQKIIVEYK